MSKSPVIKAKSEIARSKLFKIEKIDLRFNNGNARAYERVSPVNDDHKAVMIVPMQDEDTVLLIKEYSVGVEGYTLSFPKGAVDPGEDMYEAANRELMEEAGFTANKLHYVKDVYASPNYINQSISIVIAEELSPKRLQGDEPEPLVVVPWSLYDAEELIHRIDFIECRSFAALFFVWLQWSKRKSE